MSVAIQFGKEVYRTNCQMRDKAISKKCFTKFYPTVAANVKNRLGNGGGKQGGQSVSVHM